MAQAAEEPVKGPEIQWRRYICVSHLAAAWGERMWEFSAGILLLTMSGGRSLQLPALLEFSMLFTTVFLGPQVGHYVDKSCSLRTPLLALVLQNGAIAAAALTTTVALHLDESGAGLTTCVIGFSCVAKLASVASTLSVEKHWAVALAGEDQAALAALNSTMRRIDLSCKILAPGVAGFVMSGFGYAAGGVLVAAANIVVWPVESFCLTRVHRDPWCDEKLKVKDAASPTSEGELEGGLSPKVSNEQMGALQLYFSQRGLWPSTLALSMLHLTVLSFGQVMTAYTITLGVDSAIVSIFRGMGEVFGLAATVVFPQLVKRLGPANSATIFIWFQLTLLVPSVIGSTAWARSLPDLLSAALLVGGVGISRFGLWGFDLSVTQLLQEGAKPRAALCRVAGTQNALECTFGVAAAVSAIMLGSPTQFTYLASGSWCAVASAALLHTFRSKLSPSESPKA